MKIKFTPGPWRVGMSSVLVKNEKTGAWCKFAGHHKNALLSKEEAKANLVLASAAPDLLDALQTLDSLWAENEKSGVDFAFAIEKARDAISKATGDE